MVGCIGKPKSHGPQYAYNFGKGDYPAMHSFLLDSSLSEIDSLDDVETIWYIISNTLTNAIDGFVPKYKIKTNSFPIWFNSDIKHQIITNFKKENKSPLQST